MTPVLWLIAIAATYITLGFWLFLLVDSLQKRHYMPVISLLVGPVVMVWASSALPLHGVARYISYIVLTMGWLVAHYALWTLPGSKWQDCKRRKELKRQVKLHLALFTGAVIFFVPFYWLVVTSFKPDEETNKFPPDVIPYEQEKVSIGGLDRGVFTLAENGKTYKVAEMEVLEEGKRKVQPLEGRNKAALIVDSKELKKVMHPTIKWSNYAEAIKFLPPEYKSGIVPLWNTLFVAIMSIIGTVFTSSLVAYSFARLRWPGRDILFVIMLATMMVPAAVTMLPVFLIFRYLNWIDTLNPLWIGAFFGGAFNVFLLRQFFMTIPNDLEDAAKIDGCSLFMIYWKIMLPLIKPALAAITIFTFMASWNNFMGPLIYINSPEKMTLAYGLQLFQGSYGGERALMMAAAALVTLPVLVVFFFTQRYFIQGVTLTGMGGR
jgi:multiple sugar transport system permease protein